MVHVYYSGTDVQVKNAVHRDALAYFAVSRDSCTRCAGASCSGKFPFVITAWKKGVWRALLIVLQFAVGAKTAFGPRSTLAFFASLQHPITAYSGKYTHAALA